MLDTVSKDPSQGPRHSVDSSELPKWGRSDDGAHVRLLADAELQADFAAWAADACKHSAQFTGKTINTAGGAMYRRYCRDCGIATTQFLGHLSVANTVITVLDAEKRAKLDGIAGKYTDDRGARLDEIANRAANRSQPAQRAGAAEYYLTSGWRDKRSAVMERCGGLCEGCRKQGAQDVHHLSYRHFREEFLFELVGLCRDCHTRWHEQPAR